jgi:hypothetical protein
MKVLPPAGPERRRQLVWLVLLLVVLVATVMWRGRTPAVPGTTASNPDVAVPDAGTIARPEPVQLAALDAVPERPEPTRNPFGFGVRPPPPLPPAPPRPDPAFAPTPAPLVPQGPPPIALRLVGAVKMPDGRTLVTLKDPATNAVFPAFEGDVVDGRYRVSKVTLDSAVLSYVDGTGTRTVRIGG